VKKKVVYTKKCGMMRWRMRKEQQTSSYSNDVKETVFVFIWNLKKRN
jgi:hypothetical protein